MVFHAVGVPQPPSAHLNRQRGSTLVMGIGLTGVGTVCNALIFLPLLFGDFLVFFFAFFPFFPSDFSQVGKEWRHVFYKGMKKCSKKFAAPL